jgi:tetratricopeptide (TPR) repeat protein
LGRISEALLAFDREKTLQVAQKYIDKRKYDRAILEYQKVVEHEPNDARTLLRIGDLQARLGAHAEAIATYDRVALYYSGRGFSLKAVAVLKQISELIDRHAPQLADQYGHVAPKLAQIYADLGLINDALATYDAVARRLQNRGRDRDAVEIIRRMVGLERSNPLPYLRLAEALCRVSRVDEAVEHFWSAAQLLTQQGRPDDALKVFERILHFRQDARVARVAAELYLAKGSREAGLSALSRLQLCFEADPRDLDTLALLARAFEVIGQPSKGVEVYKEMVRIANETGQKDLLRRCMGSRPPTARCRRRGHTPAFLPNR